jgi:uncharacterized protein YbjT (DUF2867 family)
MALDKKVIVVIGATGNQGGSVIRHLLKTSADKWHIRGLCRNTTSEKAKELAGKGVEIVQSDVSKKDQLVQAFKGAYAVFAVTQFWQPTIMSNPETEYEQGKNIVDAAIENGVQHLIWSSLDDVQKICGLDAPHFTNKNRVEQYIRQTKKFKYTTFVYAGNYFENFLMFGIYKLDDNNPKSAKLLYGVDEEVKVPSLSIQDMGIIVAKAFNQPEKYGNNQKILAASQSLTLPEAAHIFSKVLDIDVKYQKLNLDEVKQRFGSEMAVMLKYFNTAKFYYADNQDESVKYTNENFPGMRTLEQWVSENKELLLKR